MAVHLVNPSDNSFGTAVITPRWLFVLAAATPQSSAWFVAAEFPGHLFHGSIECVAINSGGARVQPQSRRVFERRDDIV